MTVSNQKVSRAQCGQKRIEHDISTYVTRNTREKIDYQRVEKTVFAQQTWRRETWKDLTFRSSAKIRVRLLA